MFCDIWSKPWTYGGPVTNWLCLTQPYGWTSLRGFYSAPPHPSQFCEIAFVSVTRSFHFFTLAFGDSVSAALFTMRLGFLTIFSGPHFGSGFFNGRTQKGEAIERRFTVTCARRSALEYRRISIKGRN